MVETEHHYIVESQFADLVKRFPGLSIENNINGSFVISGHLSFSAEYNGETIADTFKLEIIVPKDYPANIPAVREIGGRIPNTYHTNSDGTLCLNVPIEIRKLFHFNGTLSDYVDQYVIHYLYAFCYYAQHGEMPFGEWSHEGRGILEYYRKIFNVDNDVSTIGLLRIIVDDDYRGHMQCPCGSKLKLRNCHGSQLREVAHYQASGYFKYEYVQVLVLMLHDKKSIPAEFISKSLKKKYKGLRYGT